MRKLLTLTLSLGALLYVGCGDETDDVLQGNKLQVEVSWPDGRQSDAYVLEIGEYSVELASNSSEYPYRLSEGTYDYMAYSKVYGMGVSDRKAYVDIVSGYAVSPGWFSSAKGNTQVTRSPGTMRISMLPQVRQLNLSLSGGESGLGEIRGLTAEITGIAGSLDLVSGDLAGETPIAPVFVFADGKYEASHNILGVTGAGQLLKMKVTLPSGTFETVTDMSEVLADFDSNKDQSLDVDMSVKNLGLESMTVEVLSWENGEIDPGKAQPQPSDKQVTLEWESYRGSEITAVEILDTDGVWYISPVEDYKTTGLYALPREIEAIWIITENGREELPMRKVESYDNTTGIILIGIRSLIREYKDLIGIDVMDTKIELMNDIRGDGVTAIPPIGTADDPFTGIFEGNGYKISDLVIVPSADIAGIIGVNRGTIRNVHIESGTVMGSKNYNQVGALCGINYGTVHDCSNGADVYGEERVGGLIGESLAGSTVKDCTNSGTITGKHNTGGIVGCARCDVSDCTNTGSISSGETGGGIMGYLTGVDGAYVSVTNCHNSGSVYNIARYVGGITGYAGYAKVIECTNTGSVTTEHSYIGGIVGTLNISLIQDCTNSGPVEMVKMATSSTNTGGLAGFAGGGSGVLRSVNKGTVTGHGIVGGIVGQCNSSTIEMCYNFKTAVVTSRSTQAAGICASGVGTFVIAACGNYADVTGTGMVSGIMGYAMSLGDITACANTGNIKGVYAHVGGIGGMGSLRVTSCYSTGNIESNQMYVGGGFGQLMSGEIKGTYITAAQVSQTHTHTGAFVGWNLANCKIYGGYYKPVSGLDAIGVNANTNPEQVDVRAFHYSASIPADNIWPANDVDKGWGLANASNTPANGYYWKSLGTNGATPVYPTLYWEEYVDVNNAKINGKPSPVFVNFE